MPIRPGQIAPPPTTRTGGASNVSTPQQTPPTTTQATTQTTPPPTTTTPTKNETASTFEGRTSEAPASGGLVNQQVGQQKDLSPMGARFAMLNKTAPVERDTLKQFAGTLDTLADRLVAMPEGTPQLRSDFGSLASRLEPMVAQTRATLDDVNGQVSLEAQSLNWFQKTFGMFVPDRVDTLWDQQKSLKKNLKDIEAFQAGARIGMRAGKEAAQESTPAHWEAQLTSSVGGVQRAPGDPAAVSVLVKVQDQLTQSSDLTRLQHKGAEKDIGDFGKQVAWHQKWAWLDKMIGGESGRGHLLRAGKDQGAELGATSDAFEKLEATGEQHTRSAVSELLKGESPAYAALKARFDLLEPAHFTIKSVLSQASRGQRALTDAEHWISRRDSLKMQEPTQYETVQEPRYETNAQGQREVAGYDSVTRETQAYQSWSSSYSHAKNQAEYEKHNAESALRAVNSQLPNLQQRLEALNEGHVGPFVNVDDDITHFWGGFQASFGMWSYDGGEVNDIQRQLAKLEGQVEGFDAKVAPEYQRANGDVNAAIATRRDELRQL